MMVTDTMGPVGKQEWYCFVDGWSNSKKLCFSLCFEVTNKRRRILIGSLNRKLLKYICSMKYVI